MLYCVIIAAISIMQTLKYLNTFYICKIYPLYWLDLVLIHNMTPAVSYLLIICKTIEFRVTRQKNYTSKY